MGWARGVHRRRWLRVGAIGVITAAATVAGAIPGRAVTTYTMVVTPDQVAPMELFTVTNADGSECAPNALVEGSVMGLPVSGWQTTADANGDWSKQLYIYENIGYDVHGNPIPTPPGPYEIEARCTDVSPTEVGAAETIVYEEAVITLVPAAVDPWSGLDFDEPAAKAAVTAAAARIAKMIAAYGRPNE